jgi:hypothetical protein
VRSNRPAISLLESLLSGSFHYLPTRFSDEDTSVEVALAAAELVALANDAIYYHGQPDAKPGYGLTVSPTPSAGAPVPPPAVLFVRSCLAVLSCTEIALEKISLLSSGPKSRELLVGRLEAAKVALRLALLLLAFDGCLPGPVAAGGALAPGEQVLARSRERRAEREHFGTVVEGPSSGRKIRLPRIRERPGGGEAPAPPGQAPAPEDRESDRPSRTSSALMVSGELLHILRPLAAHGLSRSLGASSFVPWVAGLLMDVSSHQLTTAALRSLPGAPLSPAGDPLLSPQHPTSLELRRRKARWMLYLLRAPVWGKLKGHVEQAGDDVGRIPGTRWLVNWILGWLVYVQKHHFMVEQAL